MVKDGMDSIKRPMRPCFLNGPPRSVIQKEKKETFQIKEIKSFMENRIMSRPAIKSSISMTNK